MKLGVWLVRIAILAALAAPLPAQANFHLMQIERVIGGVNGDTTAQAVQLRMLAAGQNVLATQAQLRAWDAAGANPVTLSIFPAPNPASGQCVRILLATANMSTKTLPALDATGRDYLMINPIPASYLAAGSLTFEQQGSGAVFWRVSWGGNAYTGSDNVISIALGGNDDNGTANPEFPGALPSTGPDALAFTPPCPPATSTNTAAQYALTTGGAVLTNDTGGTFTVQGPPPAPVLPYWSRIGLFGSLGLLGLVIAARRRALA